MTAAADPDKERPGALGRPRDREAEERIIDAALRVYAEGGWSSFNIAAVARRAGVGKSTIYLRWADKDALLNDAVARRGEKLEDIDTGSLRGDVAELAIRFHRHLQTSLGWVTLRIALDKTRSPDLLGGFLRDVVGANRRAVVGMLERAVARGELDDDARTEIAVDRAMELIYGVMLSQSLQLPHADTAVDDDLLVGMVQAAIDPILAGIRAVEVRASHLG